MGTLRNDLGRFWSFMKPHYGWWIFSVVAGVATLVDWFWSKRLPTKVILVAAVASLFIAAFEAFRDMKRMYETLLPKLGPRLVPVKIECVMRHITGVNYEIISGLWCLNVRFRNEPDEPHEKNTAPAVSALVMWGEESGVVHEGRWGDNVQPAKQNPTIDFPIGVAHEFNLAVRAYGAGVDGRIYGFSDESYAYGLTHPEYRLPLDRHTVEVWLRGPNVDGRYVFAVQIDDEKGLVGTEVSSAPIPPTELDPKAPKRGRSRQPPSQG